MYGLLENLHKTDDVTEAISLNPTCNDRSKLLYNLIDVGRIWFITFVIVFEFHFHLNHHTSCQLSFFDVFGRNKNDRRETSCCIDVFHSKDITSTRNGKRNENRIQYPELEMRDYFSNPVGH